MVRMALLVLLLLVPLGGAQEPELITKTTSGRWKKASSSRSSRNCGL